MQFSNPTWHALLVRPKVEHSVSRALRDRGFEEYLPVQRIRRKWSDRTKELAAALFPGYLFCRFAYPDRMRVLKTPGVQRVVEFGRTPVPVAESEIAAIRALIATGRAIEPWVYLPIGQHVVIDDGAFAGLRGVVVRTKDSARVVVSVEALDRSISIEVDRACVTARKPVARGAAVGGGSLFYGNGRA